MSRGSDPRRPHVREPDTEESVEGGSLIHRSPIFDRLVDAQIASTDSWSSKAYWRGFAYSLVLTEALRAWDGTVVRTLDRYAFDRRGAEHG